MQEKVAEAVELAEKHFDDFRVDSLTRMERNQYLAGLCFKLPLAYVIYCYSRACYAVKNSLH